MIVPGYYLRLPDVDRSPETAASFEELYAGAVAQGAGTFTPADFPFLADIRPHDPARVRELARSDPDGFPWVDE